MSDQLQEPGPQASQINLDSQPSSGDGDVLGTQRVRIDCAYDGTWFSGWARQPNLVTVQGVLEDALELVLRTHHRVTVAGRTDAGVHAQAQTIHLDIATETWQKLTGRDGLADPAESLKRKVSGALKRTLAQAEHTLGIPERMRGLLQGSLVLHQVQPVPQDFDARFSATGRRYTYRILDGQGSSPDPLHRAYTWCIPESLDLEDLNKAAHELTGLHDFLSFCKPREGATTIRELRHIYLTRHDDGVIEATVEADAFCHHMVRSLIGALVLYGTGKRTQTWLRERLENPQRDASLIMAPPHGLALAHIDYPAPEEYGLQARATRAMRQSNIFNGESAPFKGFGVD